MPLCLCLRFSRLPFSTKIVHALRYCALKGTYLLTQSRDYARYTISQELSNLAFGLRHLVFGPLRLSSLSKCVNFGFLLFVSLVEEPVHACNNERRPASSETAVLGTACRHIMHIKSFSVKLFLHFNGPCIVKRPKENAAVV